MKKLSLLVMIMLLSSCAAWNGLDLIANQTTEAYAKDSPEVVIKTVHVTQVESQVYVNGRVAKSENTRFAQGYVTIDLYNEKGVRIDSVNASISFTRQGARQQRRGTFSATLEEIPQKNSTVIVTSHDERKPAQQGTSSLQLM